VKKSTSISKWRENGLFFHVRILARVLKLFSKFNKRSNTPTGGKGQTGLGLYLVNTYQKAMNGKVEFISGDDKGVTVSLIFKKA
jgi:signal transduction histidine kinase